MVMPRALGWAIMSYHSNPRRCMNKSHIIRAYLIYFTELSCVGFPLQLSAVRGLSLEGVYSFRSYY